LVIEFLGEQRHRLGTVSAEAALPHAQLERGVVRILSSEIWNGRRLPCAGRAVAVATAGDPFRLVAGLGELFTFLDEVRIRSRERQERGLDACIVSGHVVDIVRRERAGDRRHDGVRSHA
jgi:hypothetical protein